MPVAHLVSSKGSVSQPSYTRVVSNATPWPHCIRHKNVQGSSSYLLDCEGDRESYEIYDLGDLKLTCGITLRNAKLAYKAWGTLNEDKSNAIVYPTWYSGEPTPVP